MGLVLRSPLNLKQLSFTCILAYPNELLEMLQNMPLLVKLDIELSGGFDDSIFNALHYRETASPHLVPMLKTLHVYDHPVVDHRCIANMVESWWWTDDAACGVSRLESVHVAFADGKKINQGVKKRLVRCLRQGLEVLL
jgi:hypothetical protein